MTQWHNEAVFLLLTNSATASTIEGAVLFTFFTSQLVSLRMASLIPGQRRDVPLNVNRNPLRPKNIKHKHDKKM
jgi:hypothetical protein